MVDFCVEPKLAKGLRWRQSACLIVFTLVLLEVVEEGGGVGLADF